MKATRLGLLGLAAVCGMTAASIGAPRKVMMEQFTASWCGPCQAVGYALGDLTDDFPNTFQAIQMHIWNSSFGFDAAWCGSRASFYGVTGIPTVQIDGVIKRVGTSGQSGDYSAYLGYLNSRLNADSDVSINLTGEPLSDSEYRITMNIAVDPGAPSRSMSIQLGYSVDAECGYPTSGSYYYDTHFGHMNEATITLAGGESTVLDHIFTMNNTAVTNTDHVSFYCFAQEPGSNGSGNNLEIYNMGFMDFSLRPPGTFTVDPSGSGDYLEIQDAIDKSINGDTILVGPGTYYERIQFNGINCTLRSTDGPEATIIDAENYNTVVKMLNNASETLDGFTLKNGTASLGSALMINGNPTIKNCIFRDNSASSNYIIFSLGNPTIQNNHFCGNNNDNIGPDWIDGGGNTFEEDCPDEPCPGDLNGDGFINVNDVLAVIGEWGTPNGDVDGDGATNVNDVLFILSAYGNAC